MKKKPFSSRELQMLKGTYPRVARKYGVTRQYVRQLAAGVQPATTEIAKNIIADLRRLLAAYKTVL